MKTLIVLLNFTFIAYACGSTATAPADNGSRQQLPAAASNQPTGETSAGSGMNAANEQAITDTQIGEPKTIRDFFMLLPEKYFVLEGCDRNADKDCRKARIEYLKTFGEVVDMGNGYLKGGCDGGQACIEMVIFKRPGDTYLVGLGTFAEMMNDYYFLDYKNGVWTDVSASVVPQFSKKNMYELPRYGTTVKVFAKKIVEKGDDYEVSEKGKKLYDLEWKDGKFTIMR